MTELYDYQRLVHKHLMDGKNVIVQAPTGTGKTRAALSPYFHNLDRYAEDSFPIEAPLPLTCRYAVPMRVLATQFEREYHDYFRALDRRGTDLNRRYGDKLGLKLPAIQTGEAPDDPKFESPLTFCTIDQLLASFIGTPYSLSPGQANLNVGAVAGSYLVLDEFHLYPLEKGSGARLTALAMLRMLGELCRFVVMTATFSTHLLEELGRLLNAEVVRVMDEEQLTTMMQGRQRVLRCTEELMTAQAILAAHAVARERGAGASLVVCNTVARAQQMYVWLKEALKEQGLRNQTQLELLHSRFTPEDRQGKSEQLEAWLGEGAWRGGQYTGSDRGSDTIIVATQVVEVGLNISAGLLHTELAPATSVIQRAGRCARFQQQFGEVIVYPVQPKDDGKVSYKPYDGGLCERTWTKLSEMAGGAGAVFGFKEEQDLIDAVHSPEDRQLLEHFVGSEEQVRRTITETLNSHAYGAASQLIRRVSSVSVVIHDEPEREITTNPFSWQSFQLHPATLQGAWGRLQERRGGEWVMKQLVPGGEASGQSEDDKDREAVYSWDTVSSAVAIPGSLRLALPSEIATYDRELGFRLLLENGVETTRWVSGPTEQKRKDRHWRSGRQASYVEHIRGLMRAYDWSVRRELAWVASRLEESLGLPDGSLDEALRLAIACHDIGKLAVDWQRWAHEWQAVLLQNYGRQYAGTPDRAFLAKTDRLDWKLEVGLRRQLAVTKPNHACAGVVASAQLVGQRVVARSDMRQESGFALTKAVLSAIARHHSPSATGYDSVKWDVASARPVIEEALRVCRLPDSLEGLDLSQRDTGELSDQWLITAGMESRESLCATWLGFMLVRALRLCDQRAERDW